MKKYVLLCLFFITILTQGMQASGCTLENDYVKLAIGNDGTFGLSGEGYRQNEGELGIYNKKRGVDYLTYGIYFDFFSVKVGNTIYANDNDEQYPGYPDRIRANKKNIITQDIVCNPSQNEAKSVTVFPKGIRVTHHFYLKSNNQKSAYIQIEVTVENRSSHEVDNIKYAKGIDPDPAETDTENSKGRASKSIPATDLVYSQGINSKAPLGIYTGDKHFHHNVAMIKMSQSGYLTYDPDVVLDEKSTNNTKEDDALYIAFDLGSFKPNEKKSFSFRYVLGESIDDAIDFASMKVDNANIKIRYRYIKNYEEITKGIIEIISKQKRTKKYDANFVASGIPEGIAIKIGDNLLTKDAPKTTKPLHVNQKNGHAKVNISVLRNGLFKEKRSFKIDLTIKAEKAKDISFSPDTATFSFLPVPRKIEFKIDNGLTSIPLTQLKDSPPVRIKILADGKEISPEEYKEFDLDIDVDGLSSDDGVDPKTHHYYVKLLPEFPLCRTKTGSIPIKISVDEGFFPGDQSEKTLYVNIQDVSWWEKCREVIINTLIVLFVLWYLFCILVRKDKFNRYQTLSCVIADDDDYQVPTDSHFSDDVPWWQKLIPCKAEWVWYHNILFIADNGVNVKISKKQSAHFDIDVAVPVDKDGTIRLRPNVVITVSYYKCTYRLRK